MKADNPEEREKIERALSKRLEAHDKSRRDAQDKLEETCKGLEASIVKFEERVSSELEEKSAAESNRLQSALFRFSSRRTMAALRRCSREQRQNSLWHSHIMWLSAT